MKIAARHRLFVASAFLALTLPCAAALSQDRNQRADLDDFVHYTLIAKPDLAEAHLRRLLDSGLTDAALAELIDASMTRDRFEEAIARGRRVDDLRSIVAELETRYREGDKARARNNERIATAIEDLVGPLRAQRMAEEILMEAGEYAVPQLLWQVTDGTDARLRLKCQDMIERIGQRAVNALCAALLELDPASQERVASMLSRIGSSAAVPYLADVSMDESLPPATREAASRAAQRLGGYGGSVADAYAALARAFFTQGHSFTNYPHEATNLVWSYDAFVGLLATPVPTPIFGEVMSMKSSRRSLQLDPGHTAALSTFIAANLKRENDLPAGEDDPIFGESRFTPEFYAMAAGPAIASEVLAMAIDMKDTVLVRDAIAAFEKTAGAANIFRTGGRQPILDALQYPDRRVRYDSALALGRAQPVTGFAGDFAVVPALASAVQAGAASFAVVLADDREDLNTYSTALEEMGFTVVGQGTSAAEVDAQVAQAPGVDLIVFRGSANSARGNINRIRATTKTSVAPIVVMTTAVEEPQLRRDFEGDVTVTVRVARDLGAFANVVDEAMVRGSGGRLSEADAMTYSIEAIAALHDIAISGSPVYEIGDAEPALADALATRTGTIRHRIAGVMAHIDTRSAQQAIFDAALDAEGRDQIELLRQVANSAKRFGNMAEARHIAALLDLVRQGGDVGEAAARAHGALNLSTENVVEIIAD